MIWWTKSWNLITGCTKCSPACANCYAEVLHTQRHKALLAGKKMAPCYSTPFAMVRFHPERLTDPLHWRKPQMIFVGNMGDVFHEGVKDEWLDRLFAVMVLCPQHTFMLLTKRPERMQRFVSGMDTAHLAWMLNKDLSEAQIQANPHPWLLRNVLHGTTVWDQASMDETAKHMLKMPGGARLFLSIEPMLGPVVIPPDLLKLLGWVICGGETGAKARPMHPDWPRSLRDQCTSAGVPFFFKQWGEWAPWDFEYIDGARNVTGGRPHYKVDSFGAGEPKRVGTRKAGRVLDGQEWSEVPNG